MTATLQGTRLAWKRVATFALLLTAGLGADSAWALFTQTRQSQVSFKATAVNGLISFEGVGKKVTVVDSGTIISVSTRLDELKTGNQSRDQRLKELFRSAPVATFKIAHSALHVPAEDESISGWATGELELNHQPRPLRFRYSASELDGTIVVQASATIDMTDHGVEPPCQPVIRAPCVDEEVDINVTFSVTE
jgi:hypothetical protein